jgi:uracil-DNA glycosylase
MYRGRPPDHLILDPQPTSRSEQMSHQFCPGYPPGTFSGLAGDYPGEDVYPAADFRTEWGPIFHRGRLDGAARVLVLGQDPATHEAITRRILVGEAGQRTQGLLARVGISSSYVMINTFLYSVYGQGGGTRHAKDPAIAAYRHRWLDALLTTGGPITAVVSLGDLAHRAFGVWATARPAVAAGLHHAAIKHPTFPESASAAGQLTLPQATAELLADWNVHLPALRDHLVPDDAAAPSPPAPYGTTWQDGDLAAIPDADLPAGHPGWWGSLSAWAQRTGPDPQTKRATITVTVPSQDRTWPAVPAG